MKRDIDAARATTYDLIIIGAGFYGIMLAYEASRRGKKALILEQNDFGFATSFNSLRIIHGGLRYLQSMDLPRFKESIGERRWYLKNFPVLTKPISCLMPLYNKGMQRNSIMWAALHVNDLLSFNRNKSISEKNTLGRGKVISVGRVKEIFPAVNDNNLKGGAIWNDGTMDDSQIVLLEILKAAAENGATPLNYMQFQEVIAENNQVAGVIARDKDTGQQVEFSSSLVINATGPWSRELAKGVHKDFQELFSYSIAWNILFDMEALSDHALAVTPPKENAKAYFLRPWKGKLFAGTIHEPWDSLCDTPVPSESSIQAFIDDLNLSIPTLNASRDKVLQIYSGLLPAKEQGTSALAVREVIIDHSQHGGPQGLFSLSGVKFTTARLVAEKVLKQVFPDDTRKSLPDLNFPQKSESEYGVFDFDWSLNQKTIKEILKKKIETEGVVHLQDLLLRRTTLGDNPWLALKNAEELSNLFDWDHERKKEEIESLKEFYIKRGLILRDKQGAEL